MPTIYMKTLQHNGYTCTGWSRINRTIQLSTEFTKICTSITLSTLVVHRQIRTQKRNVHLNIL